MSSDSAIERAQQRANIDRNIFSDRLREFVREWAPSDPYDLSRFQHDLMRLFVEAMLNQSSHLSLGIETYASAMFKDAATRPLHVIMERPKA